MYIYIVQFTLCDSFHVNLLTQDMAVGAVTQTKAQSIAYQYARTQELHSFFINSNILCIFFDPSPQKTKRVYHESVATSSLLESLGISRKYFADMAMAYNQSLDNEFPEARIFLCREQSTYLQF